MKITAIELKNYKGFEKLDFSLLFRKNNNAEEYYKGKDLEKEHLAVFIGENGSGKSSLLNAVRWILKYVLNPFFPELPQEELPLQDIKVNADDVLISLKLETGYDASINDKLLTKSYDFKYSRYRFIRNTDKSQNDNNEDINKFRDDLKSQSIFNQSYLPVFAYYGPSVNFNNYRKDIHTESSALNVYLNALDNIGEFTDFEQWFITEQADERELQFQKKDFTIEKNTVSNVRRAIELFLEKLDVSTFGKISVAKSPHNDRSERLMMQIEKEGTMIPIINLSDGEKKIIHMVGDLARRCIMSSPVNSNYKFEFQMAQGVVLIDEIDQHLHPKWQKNIIGALMNTFLNLQFLITTHSPLILSNIPKEYVYHIDNFKVSQNNIFTEGRNIESILEGVQGVGELRPANISEKVNEFYELLDKKDGLDKAKKIFNDIFINRFGENDPETVTARRDLEFAEWELNENKNEKD
ncbi:AAA family ATPase [Flammeovirga sp. OC4]|uniref:AAA family ATPase n=1 Tax=Flammeovirga sp. OC4 TaxID=1382345 RepID=UPI0005C59F9D|nr:AAA family ATPase [Flammeovirga sp. OC4]